jgi:ribonuclease HII
VALGIASRQGELFPRPRGLYGFEREAWGEGLTRVAGVDEVGRGPLAGPVVAAAVILDPGRRIAGLRDSKLLTEARRERLAEEIWAQAVAVGVGEVDPATIDRINILEATRLAMRQALARLAAPPQLVLIDAVRLSALGCPQRAIIKGDRRSASIAAASIIAKVHRDRLMAEWDRVYPGYGFAEHKGYATEAHQSALRRNGPCPLHRRSFRGVPGDEARDEAAR